MLRLILILTLSLNLAIGWATTIERPTKTCGSRNYVEETALGCTTILNTEVDGDVDTIYDDYNGNIDSTNLAVDSVGTSELQSGSVTGTKLASDSVTTVKIVDGAVTTAKIADTAVTGAKIFPNATAGQNVVAGNAPPSTTVAGTTEATLFDTAHYTSRGTTTFVLGAVAMQCVLPGSGVGSNTLTVRLYRCTVAFGCGFVLQHTYRCTFVPATIAEVPFAIPILTAEIPGGGADSFYRVTVQQTTAGGPVFQTTAFPGTLYVQELR